MIQLETKRNLQKIFEHWIQCRYIQEKEPSLNKLRVALVGCLYLLNGPIRGKEYFRLKSERDIEYLGKQNYVVDDQMVLEDYDTVSTYGIYRKQIEDPLTLRVIQQIIHSEEWKVEQQSYRSDDRLSLFSPDSNFNTHFEYAFRWITEDRLEQGTKGRTIPTNVRMMKRIDVDHYRQLGRLNLQEGRDWLARCHGTVQLHTHSLFETDSEEEIDVSPNSCTNNSHNQPMDEKRLQSSPAIIPATPYDELRVVPRGIPLTPQQSRLIDFLGQELSNESYIRWKDIYKREDLFEGERVGDLFGSIGGTDLPHDKRVRKVRHYTDTMSNWTSNEEISRIKEDTLKRALLSKRKKRLASIQKELDNVMIHSESQS